MTILKNIVEERTKVIVDTVINTVSNYLRTLGVESIDLSHIVFIGDSFKNKMFKDALLLKYPINDSNIITYESQDLAEIVNVYNYIDLSQFKGIHEHIEKASEEELEQIKIVEQERKEREEAIKRQADKDQAYTAAHEAAKKFELTMNEVETYNRKGDYSSMIDVLKIALTIKPDDAEATQLLEMANRKLSEEKVKSEQYNKLIRLAQEAFKEHRWKDACTKSDMARELNPDSQEAKHISSESKRKILLEQSVKDFLLRADVFIGQQLYAEALEELNKAKLADVNNEEIRDRILKIENIRQQSLNEVLQLKDKLHKREADNDLRSALELCDLLAVRDKANVTVWSDRKVQIKKISELLTQINDLNFNEEWKKLLPLCEEYINLRLQLQLPADNQVDRLLEKAKSKTKALFAQQDFEKEVSVIKSLIADQKWDKAKEQTKLLQNKYPQNQEVIRHLRQKIFEAEDVWSNTASNKGRVVVTGFKPQANPPKKVNDDFFESDTPKVTKRQKKTDFFDQSEQTTKIQSKKIITNDDFNF